MSSIRDLANIGQNELDFINELYQEPHDANDAVWVDESESTLTSCLSAADRLEMKADFGPYTLIFFPKFIVTNDSFVPKLQMGFPKILENKGGARSHRIKPESDELRIIQNGDHFSVDQILDISASGISLLLKQPQDRVQPSAEIEIELPNKQRIQISGKIVRVSSRSASEHWVALRYDELGNKSIEALNAYILSKTPALRHFYQLQTAGL